MPKYKNVSGRTIPIEIPGDVIQVHPGATVEIPVASHHPSMRLIEPPKQKKAAVKAPRAETKTVEPEAVPVPDKAEAPAKSIAGRKPRRSRKQG